MDSIRQEIDSAVEARVDNGDERGDWRRVGNTRFVATDGVGGEARIRHAGDLELSARLSTDGVKVRSREDGISIDVDHEPENRQPWRSKEAPQVTGDPEVVFDGEKPGLVKAWEDGEIRAELRYLTRPDSGEPMNSPWHVKVMGPDPLTGGRVDTRWSRSYKERSEAEEGAVDRMKRDARKLEDTSYGERAHAAGDANRSVKSVVDDINDVRGVRVDRWESAGERSYDENDFIDMTIERASSASSAFETLNEAGFRPVAMAGTWSEGRVVLQWYR